MQHVKIFIDVPLKYFICRGRDLNPYGLLGQGILSPLCLPIPPPRHSDSILPMYRPQVNCTYGKSGDIRETIRGVPTERLLIETDSPYLSTRAVRGSRNRPDHICYV